MNTLSDRDRIKQLAEIILASNSESIDAIEYLLKAVEVIKNDYNGNYINTCRYGFDK